MTTLSCYSRSVKQECRTDVLFWSLYDDRKRDR